MTGLHASVAELLDADTQGQGCVEIDETDTSHQTLLVCYPRADTSETGYVQAAVKIVSGAKSALDPHRLLTIAPYINKDIAALDRGIPDVTTIHAERTFWDKIIIIHGLHSWYERRDELRQDGQRISRHYYDLHSLLESDIGDNAISIPFSGRIASSTHAHSSTGRISILPRPYQAGLRSAPLAT